MTKPKKNISKLFLTGLFAALLASEAQAHDIVGLLTKAADQTAVYKVTCTPAVPANAVVTSQPAPLLSGNPSAPLNAQLVFDTNYLVFDIENKTKMATFLNSVTAVKDGVPDVTTTDPKNGDNRKSIPASMAGGDGTYVLTVSKLKKKPKQANSMLKGKSIFAMTFHCESADGVHTQTDYTRLR